MAKQSPALDEKLETALPSKRRDDRQVRLSLSISPAVADALKQYAASHGVTVTETIRRAASVLMFLDRVESSEDEALLHEQGNETYRFKFDWND